MADGAPEAARSSGRSATDAHANSGKTSNPTQSVATGSVTDTPLTYRNELRAWLAKHKTYPRRAQRMHLQGTVILYFVMDRSGHLVDWKIRKSSGHPILDRAVKEMIKSANPLPPLPPSVHIQRLALTVPVRFRLR